MSLSIKFLQIDVARKRSTVQRETTETIAPWLEPQRDRAAGSDQSGRTFRVSSRDPVKWLWLDRRGSVSIFRKWHEKFANIVIFFVKNAWSRVRQWSERSALPETTSWHDVDRAESLGTVRNAEIGRVCSVSHRSSAIPTRWEDFPLEGITGRPGQLLFSEGHTARFWSICGLQSLLEGGSSQKNRPKFSKFMENHTFCTEIMQKWGILRKFSNLFNNFWMKASVFFKKSGSCLFSYVAQTVFCFGCLWSGGVTRLQKYTNKY